MIVLWISLALLSCVWLRTSIMQNKQPLVALIAFVLHGVYGFSLLFRGSAIHVYRRSAEQSVSKNKISTLKLLK